MKEITKEFIEKYEKYKKTTVENGDSENSVQTLSGCLMEWNEDEKAEEILMDLIEHGMFEAGSAFVLTVINDEEMKIPSISAALAMDKIKTGMCLVRNGADPKYKHELSIPALMRLASMDEIATVEMFEEMLSHGADPLELDGHGSGLIHAAACEKRLDVISWILAHDDRLNLTNDWGATPLHNAADWRNEVLARELLSRGADIEIKASDGKKAEEAYDSSLVSELIRMERARRLSLQEGEILESAAWEGTSKAKRRM